MDIEEVSRLVRLTAWADGVAHFTTPDGTYLTATHLSPDLALERGGFYYIFSSGSSSRLTSAPASAWPESPKLAVVQWVSDSEVIVHSASSGPVLLPRSTGTVVEVGNTVEYRLIDGVSRVVSPRPLPLPSLETEETIDLSQFKELPDPAMAEFSKFVGPAEVVRKAKELIELPLARSDLFEAVGAPPIKGVLFTGGPGTGKTLLARIIAARANATLYTIRGSEIVSKYFGTSERTLTSIFDDAAKQPRSLVFFDEIDSIASSRTRDSHGFDRRIVNQLLSLMDGFTKHPNVLVIGTTNRLEDIDPALLRSGRFDWKIEFALPGPEDRVRLMEVSGEGVSFSDEIDFARFASVTADWSGAEIAAIWREAQILAVSDGRRRIIEEDFVEGLQRVGSQRFAASQRRTESGGRS